MAKGLETLAHTVTLFAAENRTLRDANKALSKWRKANKHVFAMKKILHSGSDGLIRK